MNYYHCVIFQQRNDGWRIVPRYEPEVEPESEEGLREFLLLVQPNDFVRANRRVNLQASSLAELISKVVAAVGDPNIQDVDAVLCAPSADPSSAQRFMSLEDIKSKAKVMIWPAEVVDEEDDSLVSLPLTNPCTCNVAETASVLSTHHCGSTVAARIPACCPS